MKTKNPGKSSPVSRSSFNMRALIQVRSHTNAQNAGKLSPMSCIFFNMRERTQARNCSNTQNANGFSLGSQSFTVSKHSLRFLIGWASDGLSYDFAIIHLPIALFSRYHPFHLLICLLFFANLELFLEKEQESV